MSSLDRNSPNAQDDHLISQSARSIGSHDVRSARGESYTINEDRPDDPWEDIGEDQTSSPNIARRPSPLSAPLIPAPRQSTPRKRRNPYVATAKRAPPPRKGGISRPPDSAVTAQDWLRSLSDAGYHIFHYVLSIIGGVFLFIRKPLTILISLYVIALLVAQTQKFFLRGLDSVVGSICASPVVSFFDPDFCKAERRTPARGAPSTRPDYPQLVAIQSQTFEQLLESTISGSAVTIDLKKAQLASDDLVVLVRHSELTSRDTLVQAIEKFTDDTRKATHALQHFDAKIQGTVDSIMAISDYSIATLGRAEEKRSIVSLLTPVLQSLHLAPFESSTSSKAVARLFDQNMVLLEHGMTRLMHEADHAFQLLNSLENALEVIRAITSSEDMQLTADKEDLLADLWTILGGNRRQLAKYDRHLNLLRDIQAYRKRAVAHVTGAITALQLMEGDLHDLRARASAPDLLGPDIPLEVHLLSIQKGSQRLREGRVRAAREAKMEGRLLEPGA